MSIIRDTIDCGTWRERKPSAHKLWLKNRPSIHGESIDGCWGRARGLLGGAFMGVILAQQSSLPYERQVDWIRSTGVEYIDIAVNAAAGKYFEVSGDATYYYSNNTRGTLFGSTTGGRQFEASFYSLNTTSSRVTYASRVGGNAANGGWGGTSGTRSMFLMSTEGTTYDGIFTSKKRPVTASFSTLRLFKGSTDNEFANGYPFWIHAIKIVSDTTTVIDAIPVVATVNGVRQGCLYDREHPNGGPLGNGLYINQGTGAFVYPQ